MAEAGTRSDALRVFVDGVEVEGPHLVGTIPGVTPLAAAGIGVPGTGRLRSIGDGTLLQWRAPGSDTWGAAVQVESDAEYLLEDGVSADRWLRVYVSAAFLGPPAEAEVRIAAGGGEATLYAEMSVGPGAPPHSALLHQLDLSWYGA